MRGRRERTISRAACAIVCHTDTLVPRRTPGKGTDRYSENSGAWNGTSEHYAPQTNTGTGGHSRSARLTDKWKRCQKSKHFFFHYHYYIYHYHNFNYYFIDNYIFSVIFDFHELGIATKNYSPILFETSDGRSHRIDNSFIRRETKNCLTI